MEILTDPAMLRERATGWLRAGTVVALVPTMGYLHAGHESLMRLARKRADVVVASVFVNPTQFGPGEDLEAYPRDFGRDAGVAEGAGVDVLFAPSADAMYSPGPAAWVEVPDMARHLCGASRPIHFRGVCTVVAKLFLLVRPTLAVFGQKDWQQLAILRRMTADLGFGVEILGAPIVREADGLALSSRNVYLTPRERIEALHLNKGLTLAEKLVAEGARDATAVAAEARAYMAANMPSASVEYLACVDPDTLEPVAQLAGPALFAVAARFSRARLIDNRCVDATASPRT